MIQPRLVAIELEGFRGFAETRRLDLDADAVIIQGDNGSGKTSVVDGLLWLFCGELQHLTDRVRGVRRTEDVVTSRFISSGVARVSLEMRHEGRLYSFTRTGDEKRTCLGCVIDDEPVEDADAVLARIFGHEELGPLRQAILTWGLLRQDAIRAALDVSGGALHERLSNIIGLERVTAFAAATTRASDALIKERTSARSALKLVNDRYNESVARRDLARRAASSEDLGRVLKAGLEKAAKVLPAGISLSTEVRDLEGIAQLEQLVGGLIAAFEAKLERAAALAAHEEDTDAAVEATEAAMEDARKHALEASSKAPAAAQLAALALGMLSDRCPVCDQPVDEATLRAHLEEVRASSEQFAASAQQAQEALVLALTELAQIRERARQRREAEKSLQAAKAVTEDLIRDAAPRLRVDAQLLTEAASLELLDGLRQARERLLEVYQDAQKVGGTHLAQLDGEVAALSAELDAARAKVDKLESRCSQAKSLEHAAHRAAENIVEKALDTLRPSFAEVFDRLNPNPAFTELLAHQDVFRNRNQVVPVVRDRDRNIDANPLLVFSEGQLNVVALSYFLGMALNAQDAMLPFLVLDDPLQALDVIATLGFSDLCRRIRDERQLIVTTHDRRFADVLIRKLSPREPDGRTIVHVFESWTREGPSIRTVIPEVAEVIPLLRRRAS